MARVRVAFLWEDAHGECVDCGRPAAYDAYRYGVAPNAPHDRLCSVCAAQSAADDGARLVRLFTEDQE